MAEKKTESKTTTQTSEQTELSKDAEQVAAAQGERPAGMSQSDWDAQNAAGADEGDDSEQ